MTEHDFDILQANLARNRRTPAQGKGKAESPPAADTPRPAKYHNRKVETSDGVFDSQAEYRRWVQLRMMETHGIISYLQRQVNFELLPAMQWGTRTLRGCAYRADFVYFEGGKRIVEDVKGVLTAEYRIKRLLFLQRYPEIEFRETPAKQGRKS